MLGDLGSDASTTFASDVSNECNFWYCGSGRLAPHGRWPPPPNHRTGPRSHQCVHRNHQHLRWVHGHPENARHVQVRLPFFFICFVLFLFFLSHLFSLLRRPTDPPSFNQLYAIPAAGFTFAYLATVLSGAPHVHQVFAHPTSFPLSSFFLFSFVTHQ